MSGEDKELIHDFVGQADAIFGLVKERFTMNAEERLAFTTTLPEAFWRDVRAAAKSYVEASLRGHGISPGDDPYKTLGRYADEMTNVSANGALLGRMEVQAEVNELHRVLISFVDPILGDILDYGQVPANLRLSTPERIKRLLATNPFASPKVHSDVWAGEPIDFVNCIVPLYLDGDAVNLELMEAVPEDEEKTLYTYDSYDQALEEVSIGKRYTMSLSPGEALFFDPRLLHATALEGLGSVRASLDFRFRLKLPDGMADLKRRLDADKNAPNVSYVPYEVWKGIGSSHEYVVNRSFADGPPPKAPPGVRLVNHRFDKSFAPEIRIRN